MVLFLVATGSAWFTTTSSTQMQSYSGCAWDPWFGTQCRSSQSSSQQTSTSWGGPYYNSFSAWDFESWGFWANGTQIEDVSGIWEPDLLGEMNLKLTGDDVIRGSYKNGENQGCIQGNFSYSNATFPLMDGIWWEDPTYQPPYSAGVIKITFLNSTALEGIFSYSDGTWGTFIGNKISGNLTEETEATLLDMPEVNWTLNYEEQKERIVSNPPEDNPMMQPGKQATLKLFCITIWFL